jgi:hypothetical protein
LKSAIRQERSEPLIAQVSKTIFTLAKNETLKQFAITFCNGNLTLTQNALPFLDRGIKPARPF